MRVLQNGFKYVLCLWIQFDGKCYNSIYFVLQKLLVDNKMITAGESAISTLSGKDQLSRFSSEQLARWDKDLVTLDLVRNYATSAKYDLIISGGYAVEAHCGGWMTRRHQDMDVALSRRSLFKFNKQAETKKVLARLSQDRGTKWENHETKSDSKIEFRENSEGKTWEQRRRIELDLHSYPAGGNVQRKFLYDSDGVKHELLVEHIDLLVANKVRIINRNLAMSEEAKIQNRRPMTSQDLDELRRLIAQPDFSKEKSIAHIKHHFMRTTGLSNTESQVLALEYWEKAMTCRV